MPGEDADAAGAGEPRSRLGEVVADLLARCPFVEARVLSRVVDAVLTERQRVDPVVRGRDVQADERIGVDPVTAHGVPAVDHGHVDVGLRHQRVGEGEAAGARSDDQIIRGHATPLVRAA